jgi:hypothetical protein
VIALGAPESWGIAVDSTRVYWAARDLYAAMSASKAGQDAPEGGSYGSLGMEPRWTLAIDETDVYGSDGSNVVTCPKGGCSGAPRIVASGASNMGIAVDATNVYWTATTVIESAPKSGGAATTLASANYAYEIAVDSGYVYWTDQGANGPQGSGIWRVAKTGGNAVQVANPSAMGSNGPMGIAVDSTNVYFTTADGKIWQVAKSGGTPLLLASDGGNEPWGIAVDDNAVYYVSTPPGANVSKVESVPIGGGCVTTLASGLSFAVAVAVDSTGVYFTTLGTVMKVPK